MIYFFSLVLIFASLTSNAFAQSELLPEDAPVIATVVHGVKYPLARRFSVDVAFARYYEDRLASTWGVGIEPRYNLSEKLYIALPIFIYKSSAVDGAQYAENPYSQVVALDPAYTVGPVVGYNPIYGKFVVGDSIQHFRAGFNGGLAVMQMHDALSGSTIGNQLTFGLQGGVQLSLQFGPSWTANLFSTLHVHQGSGLGSGDFEQYRIGWLYGLSVGRVF